MQMHQLETSPEPAVPKIDVETAEAEQRAAQPTKVAVIHWMPNDSLAGPYSAALRAAGCEVSDVLHSGPLPPQLDVVLVYGPMGSLVSLANQLLARAPTERPALVFVMTEQLPDPDLPEWWRRTVGRLRSSLERLAHRRTELGTWQRRQGVGWLLRFGHRYRYYGDLYWLRETGLLSVLAVYSAWTATFLCQCGFTPAIAPRRQKVDWGEDLGLERDIPVLWLGKAGSRRRQKLLNRLRSDLRSRGVEMMLVDGVEHPYVFGRERTILLNRTKIVLNLLREKWDDNSMRFPLAAYNGALFLSEPTMPHTPEWAPGVHLVEVPSEGIPDAICYYLEHEEKRLRITAQARQLLREGKNRGSVVELIDQAINARSATDRNTAHDADA